MEGEKFGDFVCVGDSVSFDVGGGASIRVRIEYDDFSRPEDCDGFDDAAIQAWRGDEWFFCGLVADVLVGEKVAAESVESLWGVEANFPGDGNSYLNAAARDVEDRVDVAAVVERYAAELSASLDTARGALAARQP